MTKEGDRAKAAFGARADRIHQRRHPHYFRVQAPYGVRRSTWGWKRMLRVLFTCAAEVLEPPHRHRGSQPALSESPTES